MTAPPRRAPYRHADLARTLAPRSIAIVGASPREGAFGQRVLGNLARFDGRVHLVNGRYERIGERPCFSDLAALPEVPDCAVIAVAREQVEPVIVDCARLGIGGAIVFASGYSETGKDGRAEQQQRLGQIARDGGVRIVGPNCLGVLNYITGARMTFGSAAEQGPPRPAAVGLVSQSGALGFAFGQAIEHGMSLSHVLTAGNCCDVDVADLVAYLAEDDGCRAIACVFEGMAEPRRMIDAAQRARACGKPLVVLKIATGSQGAAAAMSHTGSLAGSNEVYRAAFEAAGIVVVDEAAALLETAAFLAKAPPPRACGVAAASTSGGAAIMAADMAEALGVPMPQPAPETTEVLTAVIPEFGSPRNPCDITAQVLSDPESFRTVAEALIADPAYGTLVVPHAFAYALSVPRIAVLDELARRHGKMVAMVWLTQWLEGPGAREAAAAERVGLFRSMRACFGAIAHWQRLHAASAASEAGRPPQVPAASRDAAAASLAACGEALLTEGPAKRLLASYGVPMVGERLVASAEAAASAARELGYPVVLKVESPAIPHKTEAGVVRLGLADEAALRRAYAEVMANAAKVARPEAIDGVLVQPQVPSGLEVLVGARIDPLFGATVVVGLGGVMAELLRDSAVALAPLGPGEARALLRRLKGAALFDGFRGSAAIDLDRLADIVSRVAQFAADHAERLTELDLNPLICAGGDRIVGVDALIGLRPR